MKDRLTAFLQHFKAGQHPLHEAVMSGQLRRLEKKLSFDLETILPTGDTALHLACHAYDGPTLVYLVEHGADVNAADRNGDTPLHHLFYGGCTLSEGFAILLRSGANPELRNRRNKRLADELVQGEVDDEYGDFTDFLPQYQEIRRLLGVNPGV